MLIAYRQADMDQEGVGSLLAHLQQRWLLDEARTEAIVAVAPYRVVQDVLCFTEHEEYVGAALVLVWVVDLGHSAGVIHHGWK
jgi:hypothetical protein